MNTQRVLIMNGALGGGDGNTNVVIAKAQEYLSKTNASAKVIHLAEQNKSVQQYAEQLEWADAVIFTSGTYWDSWGSPLQKFLEECTFLEATDTVLGKPASVLITMHSVGGKGVLSRLQGVLNTFGFAIPPMSGMVYSLNSHLALQAELADIDGDDFWRLEDLEVILHNLLQATSAKPSFKAWPVNKGDPKRKWLK